MSQKNVNDYLKLADKFMGDAGQLPVERPLDQRGMALVDINIASAQVFATMALAAATRDA